MGGGKGYCDRGAAKFQAGFSASKLEKIADRKIVVLQWLLISKDYSFLPRSCIFARFPHLMNCCNCFQWRAMMMSSSLQRSTALR